MTNSHVPCSSSSSSAKNTDAEKRSAIVVVASTRAAAGEYEDKTGTVLVDFLRGEGFSTPMPVVVADADVSDTVAELLQSADTVPDVLLTTGGTGITPDDQTVEAVAPHITKEMPGISYAFWARGLESTPTAILSRCVAGIAGSTFVMTLPGSSGAVKDGIAVLSPIVHHIVDLAHRGNG
ncbi:MAG: MogA/MoaB family molybdenum cofactor biosynthesis protein [Corynebacterium sp.]|uniref:MogA/MoaB family molybdenum cofactor biosynthesis protein n=1 Tax=Corynebacterium sp. TaxID=1720 RepID=UPI0026DC8E7C|nr:MogA/MoaB family molybdenum cofactor biosynthesis protein [Corynebacterium sp.]MDO5029606.1 MogA/MoaB family molybdenum cofactor biosynthesis protein [Corynebacterium sp.]